MKASRGNAVVPETETPEARMPDIRAPKNQTPEPAGTGWRRGPLFAYLAALAASHPGPPVLGAGRDLGAARRRRNS